MEKITRVDQMPVHQLFLQLSNVIGGIERKINDRGKAKLGSAMVREESIGYAASTFELDPGINHQPFRRSIVRLRQI